MKIQNVSLIASCCSDPVLDLTEEKDDDFIEVGCLSKPFIFANYFWNFRESFELTYKGIKN